MPSLSRNHRQIQVKPEFVCKSNSPILVRKLIYQFLSEVSCCLTKMVFGWRGQEFGLLLSTGRDESLLGYKLDFQSLSLKIVFVIWPGLTSSSAAISCVVCKSVVFSDVTFRINGERGYLSKM